jgi:hypothetical protein
VSLFGDAITWVLFLRHRLVISYDGVTVVNYGRPHFFPWEEVIGFDVRLRLQVRTRGRGRVEVQALPATGTRRLFGRPTFTDQLARRLNEDHRGRLSLTGEALPTLTIDTEEGQLEIRRMLITVTVRGFVVGACLHAWTLRYQP